MSQGKPHRKSKRSYRPTQRGMTQTVHDAPVSDWTDRIHCQSAENMRQVPGNSVALTVTSPPYWNAIDYDRHAKDNHLNYRTRPHSISFDEYLSLLRRVFSETERVTRPGGFVCVVIGTILQEGRHTPIPYHISRMLEGLGLEFHQDIIWHKCTAGVKRAGVVIQKLLPGYFYPNIMTEYILVHRKPGSPIYRDRSPQEIENSRLVLDSIFTKDIANNLWNIPPVPPGIIDHPCPFPEEIPERLIRLYSYSGDVVLDPFCGAGTTLKVARHLGRRYVGYDTIPKYVAAARQAITQPSKLRERQIVLQYEKIARGVRLAPSRNGRPRHGSGNGHSRLEPAELPLLPL